MRTRSIQAFHDEIIKAAAIGADFLVVHPGSAREKSSSEAIALVAQAIRQAARSAAMARDFDDPRQAGVRLLLENTAGMGAAVGSRFEELQALLRALPELPVGVCLDTAHAFQAGYDLRTEVGLAQTIVALDRSVGLGRVAVVHANDSKTPLASRVDRHEHIGHGKIGLEAFRRIVNHPRLSARAPEGRPGRAFILETPIDAPGDDRRNVRRLWELAGFRGSQAPKAKNGFSMLRASGDASRASRHPKKNEAAPTGAAPRAASKTRAQRKVKKGSRPRG
jgi:deoxyribonuclease IV